MKRLRRLKDLEVHEVSLVNAGAQGQQFLIRKSKDGKPMPTAESIRQQLLSVSEPIVQSIEAVAKAAGDEDGTSEEAMAAMKAAGRILAPHADNISCDQVTKLMQAIGMMAQDPEDVDATSADMASNENDAAIQAQQSATNKSDDDDGDDGDDGDDEDEEAADKAAPPWLKAKIKGKDALGKDADVDDEADDEDDDAKKGGAGGKKKNPFAKAAAAPVCVDAQMRYPGGAPDSRAQTPLETAVAKSAGLDLKGFSEAQRAALEPILKSQAAQFAATEELRAAHKEAVAKSASLQHKLDRKEFVAKAEDFPHLGNADELGAKLHALSLNHPEGYEDFVGILKSANAAYDNSGLFTERGSSLSLVGDAASRIDAHIDAVVQKSDGMTREAAYSQFLKSAEGKKLYAQNRLEARRAAKGA